VWQVSFDEYAILNPLLIFCIAECDQRLLACHVVALSRQSSHAYTDSRHSPTCILASIIIRDTSFPVHFCQFCVSFNVFSQSVIFSLPTSQIFCIDPLKIHFDFDRQLFLLQLLRSCVDSRLICTSTAVTLMLHGCGGSFRPCYAHHVTEFPAFNLILLAPVTGPFVDALDRPFAVNGRDAPTLWGVSVGIFSFNLFYVLSVNTSLHIFLASAAAATFQHGILIQLASEESMVTLLLSLQYGSKFETRGRV